MTGQKFLPFRARTIGDFVTTSLRAPIWPRSTGPDQGRFLPNFPRSASFVRDGVGAGPFLETPHG